MNSEKEDKIKKAMLDFLKQFGFSEQELEQFAKLDEVEKAEKIKIKMSQWHLKNKSK